MEASSSKSVSRVGSSDSSEDARSGKNVVDSSRDNGISSVVGEGISKDATSVSSFVGPDGRKYVVSSFVGADGRKYVKSNGGAMAASSSKSVSSVGPSDISKVAVRPRERPIAPIFI